MAKLEVLTFPNPVLRKKGVEVTEVTDEYVKLARDMLETMYDAPGVGLAAPQIGKSIRLIVVDTRPSVEDDEDIDEKMTEIEQKTDFPLILFNPKVVHQEGSKCYEEGCLSVPGYTEEVKRADFVRVTALSEEGKEIEFEADGLLSVCIQHEIDHLDGKLFIDRLSPLKSTMIKKKIRKHGYPEDDDDMDGESDGPTL